MAVNLMAFRVYYYEVYKYFAILWLFYYSVIHIFKTKGGIKMGKIVTLFVKYILYISNNNEIAFSASGFYEPRKPDKERAE